MARKPKAASSNEFAASPEEVLAALGVAPAPARQGRKSKAAASPRPLGMIDSDDAAGGTADADGTIADPVAAPVRKRPSPKPKQRAGGDAAVSQPRRKPTPPRPQATQHRLAPARTWRPRLGLRPNGTGPPTRFGSTGPRSSARRRRTAPTRSWPSCWWPPVRRAPTHAGRSDKRLSGLFGPAGQRSPSLFLTARVASCAS